MTTYPKNATLLYKNELIRWIEYLRAKHYDQAYIEKTLTIWRAAAQRSAGHNWESYRDALMVIEQKEKK